MRSSPIPILAVAALLSAPAAGAGFDHTHARWDGELKKFLAGDDVHYAAWAEDRAGLDGYLASLGAVTRQESDRFTRAQRLAFWINAYNAFTVQVVLDHYPIPTRLLSMAPSGSIRQIRAVWDDFYLEAAGGRHSLNQIEHEILRREFDEPRIHVAINCASVGCPALRPEAFTAERLEAQLDDQARRFARDPRQVRLDRDRGELQVSKIFSWFGEDFRGRYEWTGRPGPTGAEAAVLAFLHRYLPEADRRFIEENPIRIRYHDYDWRLNEAEESS